MEFSTGYSRQCLSGCPEFSSGHAGMENWNQDYPERFCNFCLLYIISGVGVDCGHGPSEVNRKVRVIGPNAPVMGSVGKHV